MEPLPPDDWSIPPDYKAKLTLEDSKFIFEQASKAFDDTIETSKKILDRSTTLLTLISGVLIALVTYCVKKWDTAATFDSLLIAAILAVIYFFWVGVFFVFPNIKPNDYTLPGTQPKKYFVDKLFNVNPPSKGRILFLYIIEIKNLQQGITYNRTVNEKRWRYYKTSLNLVFISPIVITTIYLLTNLIYK